MLVTDSCSSADAAFATQRAFARLLLVSEEPKRQQKAAHRRPGLGRKKGVSTGSSISMRSKIARLFCRNGALGSDMLGRSFCAAPGWLICAEDYGRETI